MTELGAGVHDVTVQATDKAGNVTSETWRVDNGSSSGAVPTHDLEGNLLTDGHYTYTWDARNRMASVSVGTDTWTFLYDGQNRRIAESKNSTPVREWVWDGTRVMEERLTNGTKHRFWTGGIEILDSSNQQTGKRLLVHDHLGSTRAVADGSSGAVTSSYDYAPWGQRTRISGTEDWSTGYTGHWWHESGLSLAVYRPYDPRTGRWPSRDPIEERGGEKLYGFCLNDIMNRVDVLGLRSATNMCVIGRHVGEPVPDQGCHVKYYAECFATKNGNYLWPTADDLKAALERGDKRAKKDDTWMGAELLRLIKQAEKDAPNECLKLSGKKCKVRIRVILDFSRSMEAAKKDPQVVRLSEYKNTYDCNTGNFSLPTLSGSTDSM